MSANDRSNTALDDLNYIKTLAQEGANTPLLGGRIGLMWSFLLIPALMAHGLILLGYLTLPPQYIGVLWLTFGILGGILTFILNKSLSHKTGAFSAINRVEKATWTASMILIFGFAVSIAYSVLVSGKPYWLFDTIMAAAFGTYVINYYVLAQITGQKRLYMPSLVAFILMVTVITQLGNPIIYILAAIGVFFTAVLPALASLKDEPKDVV